MLWLIVVANGRLFFGLIICDLTDRIWWGNIAKSLIFMPMPFLLFGASVYLEVYYDFRTGGETQYRAV